MKATLAGVVAGLIGAGVWAAITHGLEREIGWIAWGIGALTGIAVHLVAHDELSDRTGMIAVVCAGLAIVGGKWLVVSYSVDRAIEAAAVNALPSSEEATLTLAFRGAVELMEEGETLKWRAGRSLGTAEKATHFPLQVWESAEAEWEDMSESDQDAFRAELRDERRASVMQRAGEIRTEAFKESFYPYDILWLALAFGTAYRLGAYGEFS